MHLSNGNIITYTIAPPPPPQSYVITGYNPKGTADTTATFLKYDSANGGLLTGTFSS